MASMEVAWTLSLRRDLTIKIRTTEKEFLKLRYALSLRPVVHALGPDKRSRRKTIDKQLMVIKRTFRLTVDGYVIFHSIVC